MPPLRSGARMTSEAANACEREEPEGTCFSHSRVFRGLDPAFEVAESVL